MKLNVLHLIIVLVTLAIRGVPAQLRSEGSIPSNDSLSGGDAKVLLDITDVDTDPSSLDGLYPEAPLPVLNWNRNNIATPEEAEAKRKKGAWVNCLLKMTDEDAGKAWPDPYTRNPQSARSPWKPSDQDLREWFWHEGSYDQDGNCDFTDATDTHAEHLQKALAALGLSYLPKTAGGDNYCWSIEHSDENAMDKDGEPAPYVDQHYEVNGKKYTATGAWYRFGVNQKGGAIFTISHQAPAYMAAEKWGRKPNANELPQLGKGSDIMFAYWMRNNPNPKNLHYYFSVFVTDLETSALVARILKDDSSLNDDNPLPDWPGKKFHEGSPEFEMLLGSPFGITLAYMMLQHKSELGIKYMTDVTIFRDSPQSQAHGPRSPKLMLLWTIANVPKTEDVHERKDVTVRDLQRQSDTMGFLRIHEFHIKAGTRELEEKSLFF